MTSAFGFSREVLNRLRSGEVMLGEFAPSTASELVTGTLSWSASDGATVELLDAGPTQGWPGLRGHCMVHGRLRDGGLISMPDAWVRTTKMGRPTRVFAGRLATLAQR